LIPTLIIFYQNFIRSPHKIFSYYDNLGMGLDEQIYEGMNRDVSAVPIYASSLPGLGTGYMNDTSVSSAFFKLF
jgi:hypothetical protein